MNSRIGCITVPCSTVAVSTKLTVDQTPEPNPMLTAGFDKEENVITLIDLDLISKLPLAIIHFIVSLLPLKSVLVTSILSKHWYHNIFIPFNTLVFDFIYDAYVRYNSRNNEETNTPHAYLNLVDDIVCRRLKQVQDSGSRLRTFNMAINFPDANLLAPRLALWLEKAVENKVSELFLKYLDNTESYGPILCGVVPQFILVATQLTSLELTFCILDNTSSTKLENLRKLVLTEVHICDDYILRNLSTCCPLIEHLNINSSQGIKIFSPNSCVPHLKHLGLLLCRGLTSFQVEAPILQTLSFYCSGKLSGRLCDFELKGASTSLKELKLLNMDLIPVSINRFLFEHPCIEHLMLKRCIIPPDFKLSSEILKSLCLRGCEDLQTVCIETPNLVSADHDLTKIDDSKTLFTLINLTTLHKVHIELPFANLNAKWWSKLVDALEKTCFFKGIKLALKSRTHSKVPLKWDDPEEYFSDLQDVVIHNQIRAVSFSGQRYLKKSLKDSNPSVYISSMSYTYLLDDLFDYCYPQTLSLICSDNSAKAVFEDVMSYHRNWSRRSRQSCFRSERIWLGHFRDFEVDTCDGAKAEICAPFKKFLKVNSAPGLDTTILKLKWFRARPSF